MFKPMRILPAVVKIFCNSFLNLRLYNIEKKTTESALQKLLQKQTQKQPQTNVPDDEQLTEQRISNSFAIFATFLQALTNPRHDGKVIVISKGIFIIHI